MSFLQTLRNFIPHWLVNTFYHLPISILAVVFYRYPAKNLVVIGVTGTDGKTTTSTLIYEILKKAGKRVALITSVCAKIGEEVLDTGLHVTTPDSCKLQKLLRRIADRKFKFIILETTSHGLDQHRLLGVNFNIGVVTNVTDEHLDYHGNWQDYLSAKARLFQKTKFAVLNIEDKSFGYLKKIAKGKVITYGLKKGDLNLKKFPFKTSLPGEYNRLNCLAAISVAKILKVKEPVVRKVIAQFKGVKGRMEKVYDKNFKVIIDFAHTPNALKNALKTLRTFSHRKLIAIFGCAGLRDHYKRPAMGKIACRLADKVVLTAEDPRTENVKEIIEEIASGCKNKRKLCKIADRQKAINFAIRKLAKKGDIVTLFGKGHEQSMCFGEKEHPWSEHKAVKKALRNL